jgi:hypothetical protein
MYGVSGSGLDARDFEKEIEVKTLVSILIAGALSTPGAFAGAAPKSGNVAGNGNTIATPKVPFRPYNKRPAGAHEAAVAAPKVNIGAPQLPFRPDQKRPTAAPSNQPSGIEATNRK